MTLVRSLANSLAVPSQQITMFFGMEFLYQRGHPLCISLPSGGVFEKIRFSGFILFATAHSSKWYHSESAFVLTYRTGAFSEISSGPSSPFHVLVPSLAMVI